MVDLKKIDQTSFLDHTDYLIGKLPDQTEVQIRTWIRPDSKTYHQHTTFVYNWQTIAGIYDKSSPMTQSTRGANVFRRVLVPNDDRHFKHLMQMFTLL